MKFLPFPLPPQPQLGQVRVRSQSQLESCIQDNPTQGKAHFYFYLSLSIFKDNISQQNSTQYLGFKIYNTHMYSLFCPPQSDLN